MSRPFSLAVGSCRVLRDSLARATLQFRSDLRSDPSLGYILSLSLLLNGFWIWHRVPNFVTRDERWRVVDPMEAIGFVITDPSLASLREGILVWRPYGATFYLYGLTAIPVFLIALATGRLDLFAAVARHEPRGYWQYWEQVPAWFWTTSVLLARLANVLFAVGCVYVLYRIGTRVRDRATGRLAALLLTVTWGFVVLAHEAGEDIPAVFFLLVAVYFVLEYLDTGRQRRYRTPCGAGGIATAFKLTAGVAVVLIGVAYFLRTRRTGTSLRTAAGWS